MKKKYRENIKDIFWYLAQTDVKTPKAMGGGETVYERTYLSSRVGQDFFFVSCGKNDPKNTQIKKKKKKIQKCFGKYFNSFSKNYSHNCKILAKKQLIFTRCWQN